MNRPVKFERVCLVYQAGIANVFAVDTLTFSVPTGRNAKRLLQADFRTCEMFALGMGRAGADVISLYCNRAGDISEQPWSADLDNAPFRDAMHPVNI